jgi:hypothetical protein
MRRWDDNSKMYRTEIGCGDVGCVRLARNFDTLGTVVNAVMNLRVRGIS